MKNKGVSGTRNSLQSDDEISKDGIDSHSFSLAWSVFFSISLFPPVTQKQQTILPLNCSTQKLFGFLLGVYFSIAHTVKIDRVADYSTYGHVRKKEKNRKKKQKESK